MNINSILITGARSFVALDLVRIFKDSNIKIICADSIEKSLSRYSKNIYKFYKIASPVFQFEQFVIDLQNIIYNEKIDFLIPTCEEIFYISKVKTRLNTIVFSENFEKLDILHNKWKFYKLLNKLNFTIPETKLWNREINLPGKWVLKPIYSRFAAKIQIIDGNWPKYKVEAHNPFIIQRHITGTKLCSYSIVQEGRLTAHAVYKILYSIGIGSAICFESVRNSEIDNFVQSFVKQIKFTGQIGFDFIYSDRLYCIECNPRGTSGIHLFKNDKTLANCFFTKREILYPENQKIFHEHLLMLWFGAKQKKIFSKTFWHYFFAGKNPLFMKGDNGVLKGVPIILFQIAKQTLFKKQGLHQVISQDIEYNGELSS